MSKLSDYSFKLRSATVLTDMDGGKPEWLFVPNRILEVQLAGSRDFTLLAKVILGSIFYTEAIESLKKNQDCYFNQSNRQIAEACGVAPSSVSHTVSKLEKQGWITSRYITYQPHHQPLRTLFLNVDQFGRPGEFSWLDDVH